MTTSTQEVIVVSPTATSVVQVSGTAVGPQGPTGPLGPQGPVGPQGASGGFFTFTQNNPASVWTVTHNLGYNPAVTATDISGNGIFGDVKYISTNSLTITFSGVIGGYAYMS